MADRARVQDVNEAAERAAEGGDFARAADLLGQAAALLEGDSGARGDLANTLNNLGVACERLGRLNDSEAAYRRACAIAAEAYPADHPFVVRSTENLHDFLAARGIEGSAVAAPPAAVPPPHAPAEPAVAPPSAGPAAKPPPPAAKPAATPPPPAEPAAKPATAPSPPAEKPIAPPSPVSARPAAPPPHVTARPAATPPPPAAKPAATPPLPVEKPLASPPPVTGAIAPAPTAAGGGPNGSSTKADVGDLPLSPPGKKTVDVPSAPEAPAFTVRDRKASRVPLIFAIVLLVLVVASFVGARACAAGVGTDVISVTMDGASAAAPSSGPAAAAIDTAPTTADAAPVAPEVADATPDATEAAPAAAAADAADAPALTLVDAKVCRDFVATGAEWQCTEVGSETTPGVVVYYTRIRTPTAVSVEHHWYFHDALLQRVSLNVGANSNAGYRTYSRDTIPDDGTGAWRVELRSPTGAILHEARFTVR